MNTLSLKLISVVLCMLIFSCQKSNTISNSDSSNSKTTVKIEAKGKGTFTIKGEWDRKSNTTNGLEHQYIGLPLGNQVTIGSGWTTSGDLEKDEQWQISFTESKNDPDASIEVKVYYNDKVHKSTTISGAQCNLSWNETIQ